MPPLSRVELVEFASMWSRLVPHFGQPVVSLLATLRSALLLRWLRSSTFCANFDAWYMYKVQAEVQSTTEVR